MGLYFRVAPGLRLRATNRGLGVGVGPRAARLWVGSGGLGVSTGAGPVSYYKSLGGRSPRPTSLAAYERQVAQAEKMQELTRLANELESMLSLHQARFPEAKPPLAPAPEPVDTAGLERQAVKEANSGFSIFNWKKRREASHRARLRAREQALEETAARAEQKRHRQQELDEAWQSLLSNDPETVIAALEAAFADNAAPAVPVDCQDGRATVLALMEPEEAVPERVPKLTSTGKPSTRKLSKTERNELYVAWMASNILATVREGLAAAPAIEAVTIAVLRKGPVDPFGEIPVGVVYAGTFSRRMCDRIVWDRPEALDAIEHADDVMLKLTGRTKQITQLDLSDHPDLQAVVEEVRSVFVKCTDALSKDSGWT